MLETLGLDQTTEDVYRAILGQPQMSVADLQSHLGISEEELRLALDRLSALALVRPSLHDPQHFRIVDPEVPMRLLLARQEERLAQEHQRIEQTRLAVSKLMVDFATTQSRNSAPGVEQLEGIEEIRERINVLSHSVQTEVMALAPGRAQSAASIEAARPQDAELLRRGVIMRTVYLDSIRNHPLTMEYANWLREQGGQVRTAPTLLIRMTILDREIAVVPTDGENSAAGALVLNGTGALIALIAFFENVWENAMPLGDAPSQRDEHGLISQEAEAIRLLGQGLTDEAVAKRLGVSPRTARRIAADLMEKMGARSRFQAGARAMAMGWITETE